MLKIQGGKFKGHKLFSPDSPRTRPTAERLREMVFNMCQEKIVNSYFLDICAGTGAMSCEAISRGAQGAVLVENNPQAIRSIQKNIARLGIHRQTTILPCDAIKALDHYTFPPADIVFIDPPYIRSPYFLPLFFEKLYHLVESNQHILADKSWIFVEEEFCTSVDFSVFLPPIFLHYRTKKTGNTKLTVFTTTIA